MTTAAVQSEFSDMPAVPDNLRPIWKELGFQYEYLDVLGEGKTGVAYCLRIIGTDTRVCLKTISSRVTDKTKRKEVQDSLRKEVEILKPLHHVSLPQVFKHDVNSDHPYYVCTYHPGITLKRFAESNKRYSVAETYHLISGLVNVLEYLHDKGRTHCDLHQSNLMISDNIIQDGILVIDFGAGHRNTETDSQTHDRGNKMFKGSAAEKKHNQQVIRKDRFDDFQSYDFRALGQLLQSSRSCLIADALSSHAERFDELCYRLIKNDFHAWQDVRERVQWIIDPDLLLTRVKRIFSCNDGAVRRIPLPVYRSIPVGDAILAVINTSAFQRLRGIQQLSFCDWIYPGATHSRFEHSLGVFNCTRKALLELLQSGEFSDRFSIEEIKGCLLAALLHDIGHYPFAHVIEQYAAGRFAAEKEVRHSINHATFTKEILDKDEELKSVIHKHWGEMAFRYCVEILSHQHGILSNLIDGPIDCDKIDYLKRDSWHSGLEYGSGLDLEQLLRHLTPVDDFSELGIKSDGVSAIEGLMILQDQMLNNVYWHRRIRAIMCMFHAALAFLVKKDGEQLQALVKDLRGARNNFEAIKEVIFKRVVVADPETREYLDALLGLHQGSSGYKSIYVEVAEYRRTDRKKRRHALTMYDFINRSEASESASLAPIQWDNVSSLRRAVSAELKKLGIVIRKCDVIVDVPVGKSSHRHVRVLTEDLQTIPIYDVSFINQAIFERPTAFASPIRVFVNPQVFDSASGKWQRIIEAAEDALLKAKIPGDGSEGF